MSDVIYRGAISSWDYLSIRKCMELSHCLHSVLQCPRHPPCSVQYAWLIPVYRQGNQGSRDHVTVSDVLERWLEDKDKSLPTEPTQYGAWLSARGSRAGLPAEAAIWSPASFCLASGSTSYSPLGLSLTSSPECTHEKTIAREETLK